MASVFLIGHATIANFQHIWICPQTHGKMGITDQLREQMEEVEWVSNTINLIPFQPPGPAYSAHLSLISAILVMLQQKKKQFF